MSVQNHQHFPTANDSYASQFGDKAKLAGAPAKKLAIITCMDARIYPAASLGISEGDAHVIRNAGGLAKDALRSVIISQQFLETREIAVFHHTGCGMLTFTNDQAHEKLSAAHPEHANEIQDMDFLPFTDLKQSVIDDVDFLKNHPLVVKDTTITGWIYYVENGRVEQIV